MLFTTSLDKSLRRTYGFDAAAGVAWAIFVNAINTFAFVLATRKGAGTEYVAVFTALMYVPSVAAFVLPALCRRFALGGVMVTLRLITGAAMCYCLINPSLVGLSVSLTLMILAWGFTDIIYPAFFNRLYPVERHAQLMGLIQTERSAGIFLGLLALGYLLKTMPPEGGIRVLGALGALGLLSAALHWRFRGVREGQEMGSDRPSLRAAFDAFRNRPFLLYAMSLTLYGAGGLIVLVALPGMQVHTFKLSDAQIGWLGAVSMLGLTLTYFAFSRYGAVKASARLMTLPYVIGAIPNIMYAVLIFIPSLRGLAFPLLIAAALIGSIGAGIQAMYFILVVNAMAGNDSALAYQSAQNIAIGARGILIPLLAGPFIHLAGLPASLLTALGLMLVGILITRIRVRAPAPEDGVPAA